MKAKRNVVAIDLGAESGRLVLCGWDGDQGRLRKIHRFSNGPLKAQTQWVRDLEHLWNEIQRGKFRAC